METWKPVPGYEGYYEVSDCGLVRSVDRIISQKNKWGGITSRRLSGAPMALDLCEPSPGYFRYAVGLSKLGKVNTRLVSHLVAEAFIGPRPSGHEVAHCNGNSLDNSSSNLRYALPIENTHDKFHHGTLLRGERVGTAKLTEEQAREIINLRGKERLIDLANRFGVRESAISRIQTGKRWRHLHEATQTPSG